MLPWVWILTDTFCKTSSFFPQQWLDPLKPLKKQITSETTSLLCLFIVYTPVCQLHTCLLACVPVYFSSTCVSVYCLSPVYLCHCSLFIPCVSVYCLSACVSVYCLSACVCFCLSVCVYLLICVHTRVVQMHILQTNLSMQKVLLLCLCIYIFPSSSFLQKLVADSIFLSSFML